jgi:hypothetical protein
MADISGRRFFQARRQAMEAATKKRSEDKRRIGYRPL